MPLHEDNGTLSSFRELGFYPVCSIKRDTRGKLMSSNELADAFFKKFDLKKAITDLREVLAQNWSKCVDANIVDKCSPRNVRLNVLYVHAINATVKQEILFCEKSILRKVQTLSGCSKIRKIRVL